MRGLLAPLLLAAALPAIAQAPVASEETQLASRLDYTQPGNRHVPIRCKPGDVEYYAGRSMGDVFGAAWPESAPAARIDPPAVVQLAAPAWPRGLDHDRAIAVVAVLIGPDGRAIDAHGICASMPAIVNPVARAAMRSRYTPARFDGVPGTTVGVVVFRFGLRDAPQAPADRAARAGRR